MSPLARRCWIISRRFGTTASRSRRPTPPRTRSSRPTRLQRAPTKGGVSPESDAPLAGASLDTPVLLRARTAWQIRAWRPKSCGDERHHLGEDGLHVAGVAELAGQMRDTARIDHGVIERAQEKMKPPEQLGPREMRHRSGER